MSQVPSALERAMQRAKELVESQPKKAPRRFYDEHEQVQRAQKLVSGHLDKQNRCHCGSQTACHMYQCSRCHRKVAFAALVYQEYGEEDNLLRTFCRSCSCGAHSWLFMCEAAVVRKA